MSINLLCLRKIWVVIGIYALISFPAFNWAYHLPDRYACLFIPEFALNFLLLFVALATLGFFCFVVVLHPLEIQATTQPNLLKFAQLYSAVYILYMVCLLHGKIFVNSSCGDELYAFRVLTLKYMVLGGGLGFLIMAKFIR